MMNRQQALAGILAMLVSPVVFAGVSAHTSEERDASGNIVGYTDMTADDNGNLRMDHFGAKGTATSSAAAGSDVSMTVERGSHDGTMVYLAAEEKIIVKDGDQCQTFGKNTPMPGMPQGMNDPEFAAQMAEAQKQMAAQQPMLDAAMADLAKENPAMAEAMKKRMEQFTASGNPFMQQPRYEVINTGESGSHNGYETKRFDIMNLAAQRKEFTIWVTRIGKVDGGARVSGGMRGMFSTFEAMMQQMGLQGMGGGITGAMLEEIGDDWFPVRTEDHKRGTVTNLVDVNAQANADFSLDCGAG